MKDLANLISELKPINEIEKAVQKGNTPVLVCGVSHIHKANIISKFSQNKQTLVVTANDSISIRLANDIKGFTDKMPLVLTAKDFVFHNIVSSSKETEKKRIAILKKIPSHKGVIIATIDSLMQATIPLDVLKKTTFKLKVANAYNITELLKKLSICGYTRCMEVENQTQYSLRGGILDIYPLGYKHPVRIEFFDDEIDTIAYFDLETKRRNTALKDVEILPAIEVLPEHIEGGIEKIISKLVKESENTKNDDLKFTLKGDIDKLKNNSLFPSIDRYMPLVYDKITTPLDYINENATVFIDDLNRVEEQALMYQKRFAEDIVSLTERGILIPKAGEFLLDFLRISKKLKNVVVLDTFLQKNHTILPKEIINITAKQLPSYSANLTLAKEDIIYYHKIGYKIIVLCKGQAKILKMKEILEDLPDYIKNSNQIKIIDGFLSEGFEYPDIKLAVITEGQILANKKIKKIKKSNRDHVKSYAELTVGDIVVHEDYGIGKFDGLEKIKVDGFERDYVKISFAGTDNLFLPANNLNTISKYIGSGGETKNVKLSKLNGGEWQKTKIRAKSSAEELAKYLIDLYAQRLKLKGFAFEKDDVWQDDFENEFAYEETDDQIKSIAEIKEDMQKPIPMDRLLCGDVGFGKTEVAFRAVMKCILSGKQSALLVPTTVLARQHYLTAMSRFNGFPIKIEFISRFKTPKEEKLIRQRLKNGEIDFIIGTHKLFLKEIEFKDLGLLVIDEEQRFGVAHKEKLKQIGEQIDVLTLSATPIPRTLNMALSGIRDMSILEEAPHNRHPIETYVLEYDEKIVHDAIRREMNRGGQTFYLHNYTESIDGIALKIKNSIPEANVYVAHGKMSQKELAKIMSMMTDGEIDVLVATTIIETGIDVSNANTLIIENSDRFGLSQLHQIRGRIGRSNRVAYAYLTYQKGKVLTEISSKRLSAIREFAEFGAGFKIAMRDLEIRGAGSVLGEMQSGHLTSIGYDLYLKLLEDAIIEEKGEKREILPECVIDLAVEASISENFIQDISQRIDIYRKIAMIKTEQDKSDMIDEIIDRFSDVPKSIANLCEIAKIRYKAMQNGIISINQKQNRIQIDFKDNDLEKLSKLCAIYNKRMFLSAGKSTYVTINLEERESPLIICEEIMNSLIEL